MWKMTCGLFAVVLATAAMAAEQRPADEDAWLPSLHKPRLARSVSEGDWNTEAWPQRTDSITNPAHERWSADDTEDRASVVGWGSQNPLGEGLHFASHRNNEEDVDSSEAMLEMMLQPDSPYLTKRKTPSRLGSVLGLYEDVFHGLSPFVGNPQAEMGNSESQILPAKPERRSGRMPAACRFGPFGFVCWNAARRGAVMRQRSAQYAQ